MEQTQIIQGTAVRDFVFPIATMNADGTIRRVLGTGFLIGCRGFVLTAGHLLEDLLSPSEVAVVGCFVDAVDGHWAAFELDGWSIHDAADVAVAHLKGEPWNSPFRLAQRRPGAALEYRLWGYPSDADIHSGRDPMIKPTPDLVYLKGYVRRRVRRGPDESRGEQFLEVSQVAYPGCSGGPLWEADSQKAWRVSGIYVGYRDVEDETLPFTSVGYATPVDAFAEWRPEILLGRTVREEAETSSFAIPE